MSEVVGGSLSQRRCGWVKVLAATALVAAFSACTAGRGVPGPSIPSQRPQLPATFETGNEIVVLCDDKVHRALSGIVVWHDGTSAAGALVEVFRSAVGSVDPEVPCTVGEKPSPSSQRLAASWTREDGGFAFPGLPAGTYEVRASSPRQDFNVTHHHVTIGAGGTSKPLRVRLRAAT